MADRRVTQVLTEAEYANATNFRRVTQVLAQAEYKTPTNFRRVTQILVQTEYYRKWAVPGRKGPPTQLI